MKVKINKFFFRFGLRPVRILCGLMHFVCLLGNVYLVVRAYAFRARWLDNEPELGATWRTSADISGVIGLFGVALSVIGFILLCFQSVTPLLIYDAAMVILMFTQIAYGVTLWLDIKYTNKISHITLKSRMHGLSPMQLDRVKYFINSLETKIHMSKLLILCL